jgi:hypothetical protein
VVPLQIVVADVVHAGVVEKFVRYSQDFWLSFETYDALCLGKGDVLVLGVSDLPRGVGHFTCISKTR